MIKLKHLARAMLAVATLAVSGLASASPACTSSRYIKLVIPQPAGGVGDVVGRLLAERASAYLEQPIVVENKGGASTTIGTASVAMAKPDGCTFLHMTVTAVVASAINEKKLPYDLERDLIPFIGVGSFPLALTVAEGAKLRTLADIAAASNTKEGVAYSTGGIGTMAHLASLRLLKAMNSQATHVPYRGNAPAMQGLLGGEVNFMFPTSFEAISLLQANKVRVIGITSDERLPSLPDVPTMKELGLADFTPRVWYAFLLPMGTKPEVVVRYQDAFAKAMAEPGVQSQLAARGFTPAVTRTEGTATLIKSELVRWKQVAHENNISSLD